MIHDRRIIAIIAINMLLSSETWISTYTELFNVMLTKLNPTV